SVSQQNTADASLTDIRESIEGLRDGRSLSPSPRAEQMLLLHLESTAKGPRGSGVPAGSPLSADGCKLRVCKELPAWAERPDGPVYTGAFLPMFFTDDPQRPLHHPPLTRDRLQLTLYSTTSALLVIESCGRAFLRSHRSFPSSATELSRHR